MKLNDNENVIQDTYDKGLFQGLVYKDEKIFIGVKDKKHYTLKELKSNFPKKDFENLKVFASELGKPKKVKDIEKD